MDESATKITLRNVTTIREGFQVRMVDDTPQTVKPCRECRALVLAEDMAEHLARAHDSYYPDPRPEWEEFHVYADNVEEGDIILGDSRVTEPVTIDWSRRVTEPNTLLKLYCLPDKGFLEFEPDFMLRVLRRER